MRTASDGALVRDTPGIRRSIEKTPREKVKEKRDMVIGKDEW